MQPIKTNALNAKQVADINALHEACMAEDGLTASLSLDCSVNCDPTLPAYYLLYKEDQLISFLMIFMPDPAEAELFAMTLPELRRQGYCRLLLRVASQELRKSGLGEAFVQCEPQSKAARAALEHLGAEYSFSEYTMQKPLAGPELVQSSLTLKSAQAKDVETLSELAGEIFSDDPSSHRSMLMKSFASDGISVLEAWMGSERVGLCRVVWSDTPPNICTFGIHPAYRKHGFGEEFLRLVLKHIATKGYVEAALDVNSENGAAFRLYQRMGFIVRTQVDYYALKLMQG